MKTYTSRFCGTVLLAVPFLLTSCILFQEGEPGKSLVGSEKRTAEGIASDAEMENQFAASVQMLWIRDGTFGRTHSAGMNGTPPSAQFQRMLEEAGLSFGGKEEYVLKDIRENGIRTLALAGPDGKIILKKQCRISSPAEQEKLK